MILSYIRSLWLSELTFFFSPKQGLENGIALFLHNILFFKTDLFQRLISWMQVWVLLKKKINKSIKYLNKSSQRDTEKCYLRFLSANRWQGLSCGESWRSFTSWPVIQIICEGTLRLLLPVAQWLWLPEQQFHWIWEFSEWRVVYACNLNRRRGYFWLQLTYSSLHRGV